MINSPLVERRKRAEKSPSMFLRMLVQAAVLRRGRAAGALLAMVVAAGGGHGDAHIVFRCAIETPV